MLSFLKRMKITLNLTKKEKATVNIINKNKIKITVLEKKDIQKTFDLVRGQVHLLNLFVNLIKKEEK